MTFLRKSGNSKDVYAKLFANCLSLREYLAECKNKWGEKSVKVLDVPVLLAYQMISNKSLVLRNGRRSTYVFPRKFLTSYVSQFTCGVPEIKKFSIYCPFRDVSLDVLEQGVRVRLETYRAESVYPGVGQTIQEIGDFAGHLSVSFCLPICHSVCMDEKTKTITVQPEYPRHLLDSINKLGLIKKYR
jgi:hypothetical protein